MVDNLHARSDCMLCNEDDDSDLTLTDDDDDLEE